MADEVSRALGTALLWLRAALGVTQAQLAKKAGLASTPLLSAYEKGEKLTRERADVLAILLGLSREALDVLVFAFRLIFPAKWKEAASPVALTPEELQKINRATLAAGWAGAEAIHAELIRRKKKDKAEAAMHEAREIWEQLKARSPQDRRKLAARFPEYRSWCLAVLACEASIRAAANSAKQALELAQLSVFIAERVHEDRSVRFRLQGYCWAHVSNALRVGNNFEDAGEAFVRAWELWQVGSEADAGLLPAWRMFDLEASLRAEERQFAEALDLLDRARATAGADPVAAMRILLKKEWVCDQMGDIEGALEALGEATPLVEAAGDPDLLYVLRFNLARNLCHLERYEDAAAMLPEVRDLAVEQAAELKLVRVLWLQSRIWAGQGRLEEAIAGLEQVRANFMDLDLPYDAALASLDLATLLLKESRTAEARELAIAMEGIFKTKGIHRETIAALRLFCEAARQEAATVDLAQSVIAEVEKVRRSQPLMERATGQDRT